MAELRQIAIYGKGGIFRMFRIRLHRLHLNSNSKLNRLPANSNSRQNS